MVYMGIVILVLLITGFVWAESERISAYEAILDGYWEAPLGFCNKSDLKSAQAYFNGDSVYFLMEDADGILLNKCCGMRKRPAWITNATSGDIEFNVEFDDDIDPLPKRAVMRINLKNGLVGLFQKDTLLLEMFKNNKMTGGVL